MEKITPLGIKDIYELNVARLCGTKPLIMIFSVLRRLGRENKQENGGKLIAAKRICLHATKILFEIERKEEVS